MTTTNYEAPRPETSPSVPYAKLIVQGRIVKIALSAQYRMGDSRPLSPRKDAELTRLRSLRNLTPHKRKVVLPPQSDNLELEMEGDGAIEDFEPDGISIVPDEPYDELGLPTCGIVTGLSDDSRRNLLRHIGIVDPHASCLALTLTYPDIFPVDQAKWHKNLEAFRKALEREFGTVGVIWRIEFKIRREGTRVGWCAPHFHFAIHVLKYKKRRDLQRHKGEIIEWLKEKWYSIVGSGDPQHLNAGSEVRVAYHVLGWLTYMAKRDQVKVANYYLHGTGRVWGKWRWEHIPKAPKIEKPLSRQEYEILFRRLRNHLGDAKEKLRSSDTLTCIVSEELQKKLLYVPPMTGDE